MDRITVVKMKFGSHLYGTNTPDSDLDYKGVYLPSKEEILLGKTPKTISISTGNNRSKNTKDDVDVDLHSIYHFIDLACKGETEAIDMLHATDDVIVESTAIWDRIVQNRQRFYTCKLKAFVGYARRQASKYGIKGSRLNAAKEFMDLVDHWNESNGCHMKDIWGELPGGDHCHYIQNTPNGVKQYQICGKVLQSTMKIEYARDIIKLFHDNYGARAELAAKNEGIDWKAVSHAIRAAYQVKELLTKYTITFPRPEAAFLLKVKTGKLDYLTEVAPVLEKIMEDVEELSAKSTLPEKVDRSYWDNFIIEVLEGVIFNEDKTFL